MANGHATLGASSAHRWMNCPGSIRLSEGIADVSSSYAEEGTAAHHLAERCLKSKEDAAKYLENWIRVTPEECFIQLGKAGNGSEYEITEEMCEAVQLYLDTIRSDIASYPHADLSIEKKFNLDPLYPGMFGTNDACLEEAYGIVRVYDYKHGAGKVVQVENNPQLMYYALGACLGHDFEICELVIVQPRASHRDGPVRRWQIGVPELMSWAIDHLIPAAKRTEAPDAPAIAGDWCKFCVVMPQCPALHAHAVEVAKSNFQEIALLSPDLLTVEELVRVLDSYDLLTNWLSSVMGHCKGLLEKGDKIPGWKLVQGGANRRWKDEQAVIDFFTTKYAKKIMIYDQKLRSPAAMEKAIKTLGIKIDIEDLYETPTGKLTMAPESDKRPAVEVGPVVDLFPADIEDF